VGDHYPDQENSAGYPDERKKGKDRFFRPGQVEGPDGKEIDKEAEAQSEKEADALDHEPDTTQSRASCQPPCSEGYQDFLFDSKASLNYYLL
jgi:hypothetical protein